MGSDNEPSKSSIHPWRLDRRRRCPARSESIHDRLGHGYRRFDTNPISHERALGIKANRKFSLAQVVRLAY